MCRHIYSNPKQKFGNLCFIAIFFWILIALSCPQIGIAAGGFIFLGCFWDGAVRKKSEKARWRRSIIQELETYTLRRGVFGQPSSRGSGGGAVGTSPDGLRG